MSRDSTFTYIHFQASHHADLLEDFARVKLPVEDIAVKAGDLPSNPDDEDDGTGDSHAAFGIQRSSAARSARARAHGHEGVWKDLGTSELMNGGPPSQHHSNVHSAIATAGLLSNGVGDGTSQAPADEQR